jgi:heat-inducible transcriptional repressor
LLEKPHASAGRIPTEAGLRLFVDQLLDPQDLGEWERRDIAGSLDSATGGGVARLASELLSRRSRQLGFVLAPRLHRIVLGHVAFVRVSSERVLAVLVSRSGVAHHRVIEHVGRDDQAWLERIAQLLTERLLGRTLHEARVALEAEAQELRSEADGLRRQAVGLALRALGPDGFDPADLVLGTWLALIDQPEFRDPARLRELFTALETRERMIEILDQLLAERGPGVAFGDEIGEPALRHCALVIAPYGEAGAPAGVVGVLGPSRMDYARVIPLVDFFSQMVTERLCA